ncbi:hypothetical protein GCM10011491_44640 [Brucella endophytica]|uniref:3-beta hydroxysteroid dehydrogenase/isomerase domain-containing protein n=2 Tax=Brucella endophytica TaxID=1963359 RepID=A0A916SSY9_9HYPH|nr:hypothetical protein GCM10011491_44640 [Brucella endophytica]
MRGCDMLVHAAADTSHGSAHSSRQRRINVEGTRNVFEAARRADIGKAVYISSESVLLDGGPLVNATETHPHPKKPAGSYSRTKAEAEQAVLALAMPGFDAVVIRPRFVWGRDDTTALPQLVAAVHSGKFAWIDGGDYLTSTTHVANLCHGVELALLKGRSGEVYFITDGEPVPFRAIVGGLLQTQGIAAPNKSLPRSILRGMAAVGDFVERISLGRIKAPINRQIFASSAVEITLDIGKARTELGYQPIMTMAEGLNELTHKT